MDGSWKEASVEVKEGVTNTAEGNFDKSTGLSGPLNEL